MPNCWAQDQATIFQGNGIKIGAVTQTQAIVWTRLTTRPNLNLKGIPWPDFKRPPKQQGSLPVGTSTADMLASMPGAQGQVRIRYWLDSQPAGQASKADAQWTEWVSTEANNDYTHQFHLKNLISGSTYNIESHCRDEQGRPGSSLIGKFRTAPSATESRRIRSTVVTGQDYPRRDDGPNGHRIYPLMQDMGIDFFVHTGDIEYYDKPRPFAQDIAVARFKWNRLFGLPNQRAFHRQTTSYFLKDDHDTLKNDCWPGQSYGKLDWQHGLDLFNEQFPVFRPNYQTVRWGKHLQIWLVEGRDFRSPNRLPDSPQKTIWGAEQKSWFKRTVRASDATFKILISPTPIVGPDRNGKGDNHANANFSFEGQEIRQFISQQKNMFICCGDRHWQYVSVDEKTGVREFSCGPTSDKHAGGWSNKNRTPMHQYLNVVGGFLAVTIEPESRLDSKTPVAIFQHFSTRGKLLNEDRQRAK